MSIVVVVTFKAKEERYTDLEALVKTMLPQTSARTGAEVIRAAGDPNTATIIIYEQWDNVESHQEYRKWSSENRDPANLIAMLREPPQSEQLDHIF